MAANVRSTFLRIVLGAELTRLREQAGLTGEQAAKSVGCAPSAISRVENGTSGFQRIEHFTKLLDAYRVGFEGQELLTDWYRNAKADDWWTPTVSVLPSGVSLFLAFESGATAMWAWCPMVVYGLLQAKAYTRALMESAKAADERTTEFVDSSVDIRMTRKKRITEDGMELVCIMDESALRNMVGSAEIMREQYREIAELAKLPNVTVQIIPASAPAYRVLGGAFHILDFDRKALPAPVVAMDTVAHSMQVTSKARQVKQFQRRFEFLTRGALPDHETPAFLEKLAREVRSA